MENTKKCSKDYYNTFIEKNKDKINTQITCDVCFGTYTYFNRHKHNNTKRHIKCLSLRSLIEKKNDIITYV